MPDLGSVRRLLLERTYSFAALLVAILFVGNLIENPEFVGQRPDRRHARHRRAVRDRRHRLDARDPLGRRRHRPLRRPAARLRERDPGRAADPGGLGRPVHRGAAAAAARRGRRPRQRPAGGGRAAAADRGHARHVPDPGRLEPARDARADRRGAGLAGRLPRLLRAGAGRADPDAGPRRHLDPADAHAVLPGAHVRRRRRARVVLGRRQHHRSSASARTCCRASSPPSPAWP